MKFCPNCGCELTIENVKFCYECGFKLPLEVEKPKVEILKFKIENECLKSYNGDDENVNVPQGIKTLKSYCFCNVNEKNKVITLSEGVEVVEEKAFYAVPNVEKVYISSTVKKIAPTAFFIGYDYPTNQFIGCISLKEIIVDENNPYFKSIDGNLYSKDGKTLIKYAPGKTNEVFVMPEGTVKVNAYASLVDCDHLRKVILPSTFGDDEFILFIPSSENHKGISIEINENNPNYKVIDGNVYSKDETVFVQYNSNNKEEMFIVPKTIKKIDNCAFEDSSLETIIIPDSVIEIGELTFGYCYELKNVILPNSVKEIGSSAFNTTPHIETLTLPNGLEKIDASVFEGCGVKNLVIPSSVKEIDDYAFTESYLENIFIPSSVKRLGENCFSACYDLKEVTLNEGLEIIEDGVFYDCSNLEKIKIPSTVKKLGQEVFDGCQKLKTIYVAKGKTYENLPSKVKIVEY